MDDLTTNPGSGGSTLRSLSDGTRSWPVAVMSYATTLSPGANVLQPVTPGTPMPVEDDAGNTLLTAIQALLTTLNGTIYNHNAPFADGSPGQLMLAKRRDTDTTLVADGDLNTLNMDEEGRLKVASKPASYPDITGNITAVQATIGTPVAGGTVEGNVSRASNIMAFCTGTFAGANVTFEGSIEASGDTNWFGIQAVRTNANTIETATGALSAQPAYGWELSVNALKRVRVRCTALTSGTQSWRFVQGTYATEPIPAAQVTATQPVSGSVTATGVAGAAAHDAAISGNPVRIAGRAMTANYTPTASGDVADILCTTVGAPIVKFGAIPELDWQTVTTLTTTTAAVLRAAVGAGIKAYCTGLQYQNTSATATQINILRGVTVIASYFAPANMAVPATITLLTPLQSAANEALNVQAVTTGANVLVCGQGYVSP